MVDLGCAVEARTAHRAEHRPQATGGVGVNEVRESQHLQRPGQVREPPAARWCSHYGLCAATTSLPTVVASARFERAVTHQVRCASLSGLSWGDDVPTRSGSSCK